MMAIIMFRIEHYDNSNANAYGHGEVITKPGETIHTAIFRTVNELKIQFKAKFIILTSICITDDGKLF